MRYDYGVSEVLSSQQQVNSYKVLRIVSFITFWTFGSKLGACIVCFDLFSCVMCECLLRDENRWGDEFDGINAADLIAFACIVSVL